MQTKLDHNYKRKELIEILVRIYKKQHRDEYLAVVNAVREIKATRKNKYAGDTTEADAMRWALRVPKKLDNIINSFLQEGEPRFLAEQKELLWFAKEYPEFKVAEKL